MGISTRRLACKLEEALEFFLGHLSVYSPLIFIGMLWALGISITRFFKDEGEAFLVAFSLPIIALYFSLSLRSGGELNWTAPGFVGVGLLLAHHWFRWDARPRVKRRLRRGALVLGVGMSLLALNTDLLRQFGVPWSYKSDPRIPPLSTVEVLKKPSLLLANAADPSARLRGWKSSAAYCAEVIRAQDRTGLPDRQPLPDRSCARPLPPGWAPHHPAKPAHTPASTLRNRPCRNTSSGSGLATPRSTRSGWSPARMATIRSARNPPPSSDRMPCTSPII